MLHQNLIRGDLQLTLKNGQHYERWKLPTLVDHATGLKLASTHKFDPKLFPGYKHRLTNGTAGSLKVIPDRKGAKVYVFTSQSSEDTCNKSSSSHSFHGKMLTVVQPVEHGCVDEELRAETVAVLQGFQAPRNVLEIRRHLDPAPNTQQLNRMIYAMEKEGMLERHAPLTSVKSQKPRWKLVAAPK